MGTSGNPGLTDEECQPLCVDLCRKIGLARGYIEPQPPELEWLAEFRMQMPHLEKLTISQAILEVDKRLMERQQEVKRVV